MPNLPPSRWTDADQTPDAGTDWLVAPLPRLTRFIVHAYHEPLRRNLPLLATRARDVDAAGEWPLVSGDLLEHLDALARDVPLHLDYEEQLLFPAIEALSRGDRVPFCSEAARLPVLEQQHAQFGTCLKDLARLTAWFTPPDGVGPTVQELCADLSRLMESTYVHVHLERNVLLERALQISSALAASSPDEPP